MFWRSADARSASQHEWEISDRVCQIHDALLVADVVAGTAIGYFSAGLYFRAAGHFTPLPPVGMQIWRELVLVSVIAALIIRKADYRPHEQGLGMLPLLVSVSGSALCAAVALFSIGLVTSSLHDLARLWIGVWGVIFLGWLLLSRIGLHRYWHRAARQQVIREAVALVGSPCATAALKRQWQADADIVDVFDHRGGAVTLDAMPDIVDLSRTGVISLLVLAVEPGEPADMTGRAIEALKAAPVQIAVYNGDGIAGDGDRYRRRTIAGVTVDIVAECPLGRRGQAVKQLIDKTGATALIVLFGPLFLAIAVAIVMESGGPVLFRQNRTGWCGRHFKILKFRSMLHSPGTAAQRQTVRGDGRCTRIGRFLRRSSLDELPQLWNVLRGDMSLVGPRPHADALHLCDGLVDGYVQRQRVKPGLTGWAQIHGFRGATDTPDKLRARIELDLYYIDHWSLWLDLWILARTPLAVFSAENAF